MPRVPPRLNAVTALQRAWAEAEFASAELRRAGLPVLADAALRAAEDVLRVLRLIEKPTE